MSAESDSSIPRTAVLQLVLDDLAKRVAKGKVEYGEPLTTFNGRDPLQDLYEELLDACMYIKQYQMERSATLEHFHLCMGGRIQDPLKEVNFDETPSGP